MFSDFENTNSSEVVETECGNSASEDHQTPHLLSTTSKCNSCCESFENEDIFKCLTCMDCVDDTQGVSFHCDVCIAPHVRKGHEVLDHKSLKPAFCADHKILCSMFCTKCEDLLCTNCLPSIFWSNNTFFFLKQFCTKDSLLDSFTSSTSL